ncbi:hypothetical protein WN982_17220 [Paraburkholderia sp. IMGN_8]|uniref:hypothetical protein n=1 Tax=Paraburkholderia sp. IMGN_8 TaxID=3136564 RepID=UPI003100D5CC
MITIVLALATAAGIGTGPAPIISNGSSGRMASSDSTTGQGTAKEAEVDDEVGMIDT